MISKEELRSWKYKNPDQYTDQDIIRLYNTCVELYEELNFINTICNDLDINLEDERRFY